MEDRKNLDTFENTIVDIEEQRKKKLEEELLEQARAKRAEAVRKRRRAKKRRRYIIVGIVIACILAAIALSCAEIVKLHHEKKELMNQQIELEQQLKELKHEVEQSDDPEYIEKKVREKLNMIYPDETLYVTEEKDKK